MKVKIAENKLKKISWKKTVLSLGTILLGFVLGWIFEGMGFDFRFQWRSFGLRGKELEIDLPRIPDIEGYILSERKDIDKDGVAEGVAIFYKLEEKEVVNFYPIFLGIFEFQRGKEWVRVFEEEINEYWGQEFPLDKMREKHRFETGDLTGKEQEEVVVEVARGEEGKELVDVLIYGEDGGTFKQLGGFRDLVGGRFKLAGKGLIISEEGAKERYFEFKEGELVESFEKQGKMIEVEKLLVGFSGRKIFCFETERQEKVLEIERKGIREGDYSSLAKMIVWSEQEKRKGGYFDEIWGQYLMKEIEPKQIIGGEERIGGVRDFYEPKISPDGRRLAFKGGGVAYTALYVADIDGGRVRKIVDQGDYGIGKFSWTEDGKGIIYFTETILFEEPTPSNQLRLMRLDDNRESVLTKNVYTTCGEPVEIGGWVYYAASKEKEEGCSLYQIKLDGGEGREVWVGEKEENIGKMVVSKRGSYVGLVINEEFKTEPQEGKIYILRISDGKEIGGELFGKNPRFSPDEKDLALIRGGSVYRVNLENGEREKLKELKVVDIWDWE